MYLELPDDGEQGVAGHLLRAMRNVHARYTASYAHIKRLQTEVWRTDGREKVDALQTELMKLSRSEPLSQTSKQSVLEQIIRDLKSSEDVLVIRQADEYVQLFTSSDRGQYRNGFHRAEKVAMWLASFTSEITEQVKEQKPDAK